MDSIEITKEPRLMPKNDFDVSSYSKSVFSMFGGEETSVLLRFSKELAGVVFDKFGMDVSLVKDGAEHFICNVKVMVSPFFLSWVMSFGTKAKILSPQSVIDEMQKLLLEIQNNYRCEE